MNKCELCNFPPTSYCESDNARLCWTCDREVHNANFLVARHVRILLCRSCFSVTPWMAAGPDLGRSLSICHTCLNERNSKQQLRGLDESESDNDDVAGEDGTDGESQFVPLSLTTPPPADSSSSSSSNQEPQNDNAVTSYGRISPRRPEITGECGGGVEAICVDSLNEAHIPVKRGSGSASHIKRRESETVGLSLARNTKILRYSDK